jgi:hypothetical protein
MQAISYHENYCDTIRTPFFATPLLFHTAVRPMLSSTQSLAGVVYGKLLKPIR